MDELVIEGVRPWDGRYEFDIVNQPPTNREWGWIKRFSGYLPLTIDKGLDGGDPELFAAFAVIALHRAGRIQPAQAQDVFDRFADVPFGSTVRLELGAGADAEDGEDRPPAESSGESSNGSGTSSRTSSDPSEPHRPTAGTPDLATSVSVPARSPT